MFRIALRNIFRQKARSILSLSTIAFGCIALMFVAGFFDNTLAQMKGAYINAHIGNLQVFQKGFSKNSATAPYSYLIKNSTQIIESIINLPEVKSVGRRLQFSALISTGQTSVPCIVQGVDLDFDRTFKISSYKDLRDFARDKEVAGIGEMVEGEGLSNKESQFTAILGLGLAESMGVVPNVYVTVMNSTIQGGNNAMDLKVNGIMRTAAKDFDDIFLRLPLSTAQKMLNTQSIMNIIVKLHHNEDTIIVKRKLERIFAQAHLDLEIKTWDEISDFYVKSEKLFNMFHLVMRVVISIAVILGIFNTMNMAVLERFSEIGTLMAMGIKRRKIMLLFLSEGFLLGFIGGGIGVFLGCIVLSVTGGVGIVMPPPPGSTSPWLSQPSLNWGVLVFTFFLSVLIGGFSSLAPAFKASRLKVVEALRYR